MFYFSSDDLEIAGASPETLVKVDNQTAYTFPLAGTRPRGKDEKEDQELEADLLSDEKELAEHNMLVDLGRNDLGQILPVRNGRSGKISFGRKIFPRHAPGIDRAGRASQR